MKQKHQISNLPPIPHSGARGFGARGNNKRYYLHRRVKKFSGVIVIAKEKTLHTPFTQLVDMPERLSYYVQQLIKLGYNIQIQLFN